MGVKLITQAITPVTSVEVERVAPAASTVKAVDSQKEQPVKVTKEDAQNISDVMNEVSKLFNSQLNFEVYEDTNQLYVQIVDAKTREVIKQIPPEEMLELSAKIQKMVGLILDKYA